jgi:hypothetical protein
VALQHTIAEELRLSVTPSAGMESILAKLRLHCKLVATAFAMGQALVAGRNVPARF